MFPVARRWSRTLVIAAVLMACAGGAVGQDVIVTEYCPPRVSYYYPASVSYYAPATRVVEYSPATISYYSPRVVYSPVRSASYYEPAVRSVSYYEPATVTYYRSPTVSYYPGTVSETRYGVFGRPRERTTYYPSYIVR
jgi:hypothetical protein